MQRDALHRRQRHAPPSPSLGRLILSSADLLLFEAIARHGPLPSSYLYEFTRHLRRDRSHLQNRLTEFYNGDAGGPYLARPPQQFASFSARYQHLAYDLSTRANLLLRERDARGTARASRGEPFVHRLMSACVGASFELTAPSHGLQYISLAEILSHPSCGPARDQANPLAILVPGTTQTIIPDQLFGLHYPGVGYRFFAVECDRNTESIERRNLRQSALARKFAGYAGLFESRAYRSWWGVPNLHVLIVTTSETHARNILSYIKQGVPVAYAPRFLIAVATTFGADWRVPQAVLSDLIEKPWITAEGAKYLCWP